MLRDKGYVVPTVCCASGVRKRVPVTKAPRYGSIIVRPGRLPVAEVGCVVTTPITFTEALASRGELE